jgi:short-subunit dehydrogenase
MTNKVVVVTGGSDGLGKTLAETLSTNYKVVILARSKQTLKEIANKIECDWFACDVKNPEQVTEVISAIVAKYGKIDVLINNAGVIINGELVDTSYEDIENVITTNTLGSIYVAKAVLEHMKPQKSGLIVNIISQSGLNARANRSIYNASKFALTGFTKALQQETAQYGVRVTGFYPGTVKTDLFAKAGLEMKGPAMSTDDAVKVIQFVLSLKDDVVIPELGIKHSEG